MAILYFLRMQPVLAFCTFATPHLKVFFVLETLLSCICARVDQGPAGALRDRDGHADHGAAEAVRAVGALG